MADAPTGRGVAKPEPIPSYDDKQNNAPLVTCSACGKQAYMTHGGPVCAACTMKNDKRLEPRP